MIFKLYSIKDELEGYTPTIPFTKEEIAIRYFRTHLEKTPLMEANPGDYSLWYIGTFDNETGTINAPIKEMKMIERGHKHGSN